MENVPLYPQLSKENKILGLEFIDFGGLIFIYLILFLASKNLILNALLIGTSYFLLRRFKKGKPPRYTEALIKFLLRPRKYTQSKETHF